jgi:hypothetical protein
MAKTKPTKGTPARTARQVTRQPAASSRTAKAQRTPRKQTAHKTGSKPVQPERGTPLSANPAAAVPAPPGAQPRIGKQQIIADLLQRAHGAALSELTEATGWLPHSVRAVMTGLRKTGCEIARSKDTNGVSRFRIVADG